MRLVVGDAGGPGGARAALEFPYVPRAELLQPGEAAELLVLSRDEEFVTFKVRLTCICDHDRSVRKQSEVGWTEIQLHTMFVS